MPAGRASGEGCSPDTRAASPSLRAALRKGPGLAGLISAAAGVLRLAPAEVLFRTGFGREDRTPGRLDAALAELSAALFLAGEGFVGLGLVGRGAGRTADLRAGRGGEEYLFEVRWVGGGFGPDAPEKLTAKCRRKAAQVRAGMKAAGTRRGGVIFVAGTPGPGPFAGSERLLAAAAAVKVPERRTGLHICLISGGEAAVHPPWP